VRFAMGEKIKIIDFVNNQLKERYKSFVVFGPAMSGKSEFARKLAVKTEALYIDLLADFLSKPELSGSIDTFEPQDLKKYLRNIPFGGKLIVIDNIDFLINTWNNLNKEHFLNFIERDEFRIGYCFILQAAKFLRDRRIENSIGQNRVLNIYNVE